MRDLPYQKIDTIKLKPCPFCGHTQQHSQEERVRCWIGGGEVYVQCGVCKAQGFRVPLPGHIDELNEFINDVDLTFFDLSDNPREWESDELYLWMALFAARFWNNRHAPRDP